MRSLPPPLRASTLALAVLTGLVACDRGGQDSGTDQASEASPPEVRTMPKSGSPSASPDDSANSNTTSPSAPRTETSLTAPQQRQVVEAVAEVIGGAPGSIALDQPILDPGKGVEEFELLDILLGIEDRFDIEISEDAIERATGGRFDDVQKQLTPRQLFGIVSEALGE